MKPIAKIYTDFSEKFGIPRQSGIVQELQGRIVMEKEYSNPDAFRGLEEFSHIWLLWEFDKAIRQNWSPTVRPPRLGGNERKGVFATRSPFRPNSIGLSCVKLEKIDFDAKEGVTLWVAGVDLLNGTPIYDIKPYLPYVDSYPEASNGFAEDFTSYQLEVEISDELLEACPKEKQDALKKVLAQDPRPAYQEDAERIYGMEFAGLQIRFRVIGNCLKVCEVKNESGNNR